MRNFVSDDILQLSSELRFNKHITRIEKTLCTDTLSISDSIDFLCWDEDLRNQILKATPFDFLFEILFGFFLFSACCSQDLPFLSALAHKQLVLESVDEFHCNFDNLIHREDYKGKNH